MEPTTFTPESIETFLPIDDMFDEIETNQKDLPLAIKANQNAGSSEAEQNAAAIAAILGTQTTTSFPVQTPEAALGGVISTASAAPAATTTAALRGGGRNRNGNAGGNGNGNANRNGNNNGNAGGNGNANANRAGNGNNGNGNGKGNGNNQRNQRRAVGPDRRYVVIDDDLPWSD